MGSSRGARQVFLLCWNNFYSTTALGSSCSPWGAAPARAAGEGRWSCMDSYDGWSGPQITGGHHIWSGLREIVLRERYTIALAITSKGHGPTHVFKLPPLAVPPHRRTDLFLVPRGPMVLWIRVHAFPGGSSPFCLQQRPVSSTTGSSTPAMSRKTTQ
jgi:hypothetical protein